MNRFWRVVCYFAFYVAASLVLAGIFYIVWVVISMIVQQG